MYLTYTLLALRALATSTLFVTSSTLPSPTGVDGVLTSIDIIIKDIQDDPALELPSKSTITSIAITSSSTQSQTPTKTSTSGKQDTYATVNNNTAAFIIIGLVIFTAIICSIAMCCAMRLRHLERNTPKRQYDQMQSQPSKDSIHEISYQLENHSGFMPPPPSLEARDTPNLFFTPISLNRNANRRYSSQDQNHELQDWPKNTNQFADSPAIVKAPSTHFTAPFADKEDKPQDNRVSMASFRSSISEFERIVPRPSRQNLQDNPPKELILEAPIHEDISEQDYKAFDYGDYYPSPKPSARIETSYDQRRRSTFTNDAHKRLDGDIGMNERIVNRDSVISNGSPSSESNKHMSYASRQSSLSRYLE
ncbi:hypothetical protein BC833DRAFT_587300 [Globomyces pollinis-pini]|nr:hypothetical protein BC833DRAFT_587300 [Globomyces pollinis-pini]